MFERLVFSMKKIKFPPEIIKEYGEQIWRDQNYNKNGYDSNSYNGSEVAAACGEIEEKDKEKFRKTILEYARKHRKPKGFF